MPRRRATTSKTCRGKKRYASQREARAVALHQQNESGHPDIWEYACLKCGGWHLGHDPGFEPGEIYGFTDRPQDG